MTQPQFDARETFQSIEMDKSTDFIIVEGNEVDVFDNALRGILNKKGEETDWVVVSGSDKKTILDFFRNSKADNAFAILDKDFTGEKDFHKKVNYLSRYSVENFLLDEAVVRQTNARFYRKTADKINLDIGVLVNHYRESLLLLLNVLKKYQVATCEHNISWSENSILVKDCWKVNVGEVERLIDLMGKDYPECREEECEILGDVIKEFPAKLIVKGIYHFIKKIIVPPGFTKVFNNEKAFSHALFNNIEYSKDFMSCLGGAKDFLSRK